MRNHSGCQPCDVADCDRKIIEIGSQAMTTRGDAVPLQLDGPAGGLVREPGDVEHVLVAGLRAVAVLVGHRVADLAAGVVLPSLTGV